MQNYSAWLTRNVSISLIDWKVLDNKENLPNLENGIGFVTKKTQKKRTRKDRNFCLNEREWSEHKGFTNNYYATQIRLKSF